MGEHDAFSHAHGDKEILVVEDHEPTAQMVLMALEDAGYNARWVGTAGEALEQFTSHEAPDGEREPDLILLDLTLPDMDPLDLMEQIEAVRGSKPPIVVVSAKSLEVVRATARALHAVAVVHKPFPIDTLINSVDQALNY